jgi:N-acyl-D-aspartate/D-glutamate deacylase
LRKATGVSKAVDEVLKLCRESGARTVITNFLPVEGQREEYERALEKIEALDDAVPLYFDVAPFEINVRPVYRFLPDWAQTGSMDDMAAHMDDEWLRPRLLKDFPELDPEKFHVARARHNETVVGYSLRDIMELYGIKQPAEALYKLMQTTKLRALISYRNIDQQAIARALCHPRSLIASKGVSFIGHGSEKARRPDEHAAAFPLFVDTVTKNELMPLGAAIRKITTVPATFFGLGGRRNIAEGAAADLVLFSYAERQMAIKAVIVNGRIAAHNGVLTGVCAGTPIRRQGKP